MNVPELRPFGPHWKPTPIPWPDVDQDRPPVPPIEPQKAVIVGRELPYGIPFRKWWFCSQCLPWVMNWDHAPGGWQLRTLEPLTLHFCHGLCRGLGTLVRPCDCQGKGAGHARD